jgi:hypothetical protein
LGDIDVMSFDSTLVRSTVDRVKTKG